MGGRRPSVASRERAHGPAGVDASEPTADRIADGPEPSPRPRSEPRQRACPEPRPRACSEPRPRASGERYRPTDRVKRRREFQAIQASAGRVHTPQFVLLVRVRDSGPSRLGVTVTKKIGNAVVRNRIKRVVREVFRKNRDRFPTGCDVVFVARAGAESLGYDAVLGQLRAAEGALRGTADRARRRRPEAPR